MTKLVTFLILVLGAILLAACSKEGEKPILRDIRAEKLKEKLSLYVNLSREHQDQYGFVMTEACDAALFSGLYSIHPELDVVFEAIIDDKGRWHRRPAMDCYPEFSKSTISRDMFIGILWGIWRNQRLDLAEKIWDYGQANDWIMGEGDKTRINFTPNMQSLLARVIYHLGGNDYSSTRKIPLVYFPNTGFQAHLDGLAILLNAEMEGSMPQSHFALMDWQHKRTPRNFLFSYGFHKYKDGDFTEAYDILLNESLFPANRLPRSIDRFTPVLWERDDDADWLPKKPDQPDVEHVGVDFIFAATILLGL